MKKYLSTTQTFLQVHKKEIVTSLLFILGVIILLGSIILFIQNSKTKIVYQPVKACDLLSMDEAKELLGNRTLRSRDGTVFITGNSGNSECGYTDGNPDIANMVVAALIVRSGVNDKGVEKNKADFAAARPDRNIEVVKDLGDSAYFNHDLGQLNILDGREWIILSYGVGQTPETNTVEAAVAMAHKIVKE